MPDASRQRSSASASLHPIPSPPSALPAAASARKAQTQADEAQAPAPRPPAFDTPIALDRDLFMRRLITSFSHLSEGILGSDVAGAYVMQVGLSMGAAIEAEYKHFWGITDRPFTLDEYAHVIVDLKQKIHGNFSLVSKDADRVVVRTTSCPFDELVRQSPSLCFMTSSVFGGIAARNFGYAKVVLHKRIALGDDGCYVTVHLRRTAAAAGAIGKEYFPDVDRASPDIADQLRLMERVRQLRQRLGELHARWEVVVSAAAEAIVVTLPSGDVAYANGRWRDLLGVEGDELAGGTLGRIIHPDDLPRVQAAYARALGGERVLNLDARVLHRDGRWRDVLGSLGPVRDEDGAVVGVLGIARDVTDEREAVRLKDDFLSTASHELRTPVTTIRTLTELLLRASRQGKPLAQAELERRLELIRQQTDRLANLSTDLLDASRIQRGKLVLDRQWLDLRELVATVAHTVEGQLMTAGARARANASAGHSTGQSRHRLVLRLPEEPVRAYVDRARTDHILANLLENAMKYSPDGGEVTITLEVDHLSRGAADEGSLRAAGEASDAWSVALVRVSDQGIGIPEADLPKLFTPFYRGSNASSHNFSGVGLGLYLGRTMAEAQGGTLEAAGLEGQGATFTLTLPVGADVAPADDDAAAAAAAAPESEQLS